MIDAALLAGLPVEDHPLVGVAIRSRWPPRSSCPRTATSRARRPTAPLARRTADLLVRGARVNPRRPAVDDALVEPLPVLAGNHVAVLVLDEAHDARGLTPVALLARDRPLRPRPRARPLEHPLEREEVAGDARPREHLLQRVVHDGAAHCHRDEELLPGRTARGRAARGDFRPSCRSTRSSTRAVHELLVARLRPGELVLEISPSARSRRARPGARAV